MSSEYVKFGTLSIYTMGDQLPLTLIQENVVMLFIQKVLRFYKRKIYINATIQSKYFILNVYVTQGFDLN